MSKSIARLLFVFFLAFVASVARGEKKEAASPEVAKPSAVLAGSPFIAFPEAPQTSAVRVIYSDEEVDIVDLPEPKKD